ncbi:MAG TPA: nucleoside triphosphate pyrophosphohydrolase [Acidimicrobiia bacterium]|nr:nucleoside triphosphate pyrophosphohydrolase [Acidimicrobiia bacterium]
MAELAQLAIVGLGPAGLDRIPAAALQLLTDPTRPVVLRTRQHPAAAELAMLRDVADCDDVYNRSADFEAVYGAIAERVCALAEQGPVTYAVPGSAVVGERAVAIIRNTWRSDIELHPGESFLDLVWAATGCDPITDGAQVLDGRDFPDPLQLHLPTVVTQVDRPEVLADVVVALGKTLHDEVPVTILDRLGDADETVATVPLRELVGFDAGPRTSLFLVPPLNGWYGLVATNRRLRRECPWDRKQTHHTLLSHLIEETYETVEAVTRLGEEAPGGAPDFGAYAEVEEELGDLLLQVVFHATLAEEPGAFGVEEVAEGIRRKLVYRHPHVFGDVVAEDSETVKANWEELKAGEKARESLMDDVPQALPALARADKLQRRAASAGFDWTRAQPVLAKLREEVGELAQDIDDRTAATHELGDVLFSVVNLARHLDIDSEIAFRMANDRFEARFRTVETLAAQESRALDSLTLEELDELWERAKSMER